MAPELDLSAWAVLLVQPVLVVVEEQFRLVSPEAVEPLPPASATQAVRESDFCFLLSRFSFV